MSTETMERESGKAPDELRIDWHHRMHDAMMEYQRSTSTTETPGRLVDPVSKREFPPGEIMVRDPNRAQRRRLDAWRRTGKMPSKR